MASGEASKLNAYAVLLTPNAQASKLNAYAVLATPPPSLINLTKVNAYGVLFPNNTMWTTKVNAYGVLFPNNTLWLTKTNAYAVLFPIYIPPIPQARAMVMV